MSTHTHIRRHMNTHTHTALDMGAFMTTSWATAQTLHSIKPASDTHTHFTPRLPLIHWEPRERCFDFNQIWSTIKSRRQMKFLISW